MQSSPEPIRLTELGAPVELALSEDVAATLAASGVVTVNRPPWSRNYLIGPAGHVGVAVVGGVEVRIVPKVPVDRLLFLLGYVQDPSSWRAGGVTVAARDELLPAVAEAFRRQAERAVEQGVMQGYRETEESLPVLRGRLREKDQLAIRYGLAMPLEVRYDEWTTDIAENRLLLAAARRLLRLPGVAASTRRGLVRLAGRFDEVRALLPGRSLPRWSATRLNVRYHAAVRLAELVLRGGSFDQPRGDVRVDGFLVSMPKVFEAFVVTALGEQLTARYGGRAVAQDLGHLDVARRVDMRPDLVWYDDAGRPRAVVDAKYKAEKLAGYPNADLYQLLAYCTALGLRVGHLVYAGGNADAQEHVVRHAGTRLLQHALDLSVSPVELLRQVDALADGLVDCGDRTDAA